MRIYGNNGYPEVVKGTPYMACSVFSGGEHSWDDIYFFCDDPSFEFRTPQDSPWLTKRQCDVLNLPHRKLFWRKEDRTYSLDQAAIRARAYAAELVRIEPNLKAIYADKARAFENDLGGWLPNGAEPVGSIVAEELAERQRLRQAGDMKSADTIRRVVTGGNVIVQDMPNGTAWFFSCR